MSTHTTRFGIWGLTLGYFLFYIPYSGLTKALSKGLLPGMDGPISGFELLPATALATTTVLLLYLALTGGFAHLDRRRILGVEWPVPRAATFISGLATALIIATTTLNYTFVGISIVFALLLMRGGVLVMSPVIDRLLERDVQWYSWAALGLSLVAIVIAFAEVGGYHLSMLAGLNIGAYLLGYLVRLQCMTRIAKSQREEVNQRYFVEETTVAALALLVVPGCLALVGHGPIMLELRTGFTSFLASELLAPALLIGMLYACLYVFGSRIYLDRRENTFCVPLNRCSSLLSGVVASFALALVLDQSAPSSQQLTAAAILAVAMAVLAIPTLSGRRPAHSAPATALDRAYLFVCNDNTCRSPMAEALCRRLLASIERISHDDLHARIVSAGLRAETAGAPMSPDAQRALFRLGSVPHEHRARPVTEALLARVDHVFCMTDEHCRILADRHPRWAAKVRRLHPDEDLRHDGGSESLEALGERIDDALQRRFDLPLAA
ncbi:MAG: hypothetical protein AAGC60_25755 [Acidobacteriota bacterium]